MYSTAFGIPVRKELDANMQNFLKILRVKPKTLLDNALKMWLQKKRCDFEPTWNNLCHILCLMKLNSLAEKVKAFFEVTNLQPPPISDTSNQHERSNQLSAVESYHAAIIYEHKPPNDVLIYFTVVCSHHYVRSIVVY